jgi:dolichol-phosphate mannosyltransferase
MPEYDFTLLIPTYNEVQTIQNTLKTMDEMFKRTGRNVEIIVVDDSSKDGTIEAVLEIIQDIRNCKLHVRTEDPGLSESIVDGIKLAESKYVCVTDADLQHDVTKIEGMYLKSLEGYDIIIGTRYGKGGGITDWSFKRRVISWGANVIAKVLFPYTSDSISGFFMIRKSIADATPVEPRGYKILMEYVGKGKWESIYEVPFMFTSRKNGSSKLKSGTIFDYIMQVIGLIHFGWLHRDRNQYEGRVWNELRKIVKFGVVGGSGVIVNTGILYILTSMFGVYLLLSSLIAIETAVITNFCLNDKWTFGNDVKRRGLFERFLLFNGISIAGIVINISILWMLTEYTGIYYLWANIIGILVAFSWNFMLNKNITFIEGKHLKVD